MNKSIDRREYQSQWYQENKETIKARYKRYREEHTINAIFAGRKSLAKSKGIEFTITIDQIEIPDCCPILKVPFQRHTQHAMSLDRIDPKKGYIPGNVQVLSRRANAMKNDASPEELLKFADWIYQVHG